VTLTYKESGVDIDAGDALVDRIVPMARTTRTPLVLDDVGGFAGLCRIPPNLEEPILVAGTDGVGTKLKLAFDLGEHRTVGIDLVAMSVNDVITTGATPLFFLDYYATSKLDVDQAAGVIAGIVEGCKQSGCALLGGETAELPGFYAPGEYDLAGFAVGIVDRKKLVNGTRVAAGDIILGVNSSGLHSNGYSLARKALLERGGRKLTDAMPGSEKTLGATLLEPTRIYARAARAALDAGDVKAMSHITGGGIEGNLPRVLPDGVTAEVRVASWQRPAIFSLIQSDGGVEEAELRRTLNVGIGFVLVVAPASADAVLAALRGAGEGAQVIGEIVSSRTTGSEPAGPATVSFRE
jgi:phosphoribosylformylglycinamidine cyclo-ligase